MTTGQARPARAPAQPPRTRDAKGRAPAPPALTASPARPALPAAHAPRRFIVRPILGPAEGLDVTDAVVSAIASELRRLHAGNDVLNRIEAERLLQRALASCALTSETHPG